MRKFICIYLIYIRDYKTSFVRRLRQLVVYGICYQHRIWHMVAFLGSQRPVCYLISKALS